MNNVRDRLPRFKATEYVKNSLKSKESKPWDGNLKHETDLPVIPCNISDPPWRIHKVIFRSLFFPPCFNSQALPTPPTEIKTNGYRMILTNPDYSLYRVRPNLKISWQFITFCNVLYGYTPPPPLNKSKKHVLVTFVVKKHSCVDHNTNENIWNIFGFCLLKFCWQLGIIVGNRGDKDTVSHDHMILTELSRNRI